MKAYKLIYNEFTIPYEVQRKNVKNINIRIKPNGIVYVSAHKNVSQSYIESVLKNKADWIIQSILQFQEKDNLKPKSNGFITGDQLYYLGQLYPIKVIECLQEEIVLHKNILQFHVKDEMNTMKKQNLYQTWLREQATVIFQELLNQEWIKVNPYITKLPILKIRKMKSRWGTCFTTKNTIQLNLELIKKPLEAIEYVILHELAHFVHPNHSKDFYAFVQNYMPDWKQRRALLK
ncbi:MAG: hypothetical protein CVU84_11675 [Firmicutes bacterium HGW-Firmicutes-1]|jgi:hypothetical protein|nr:MAG: hypothetical protein CVU84_11675 [Firmicutes bacterium HGW-Firmicutes-1]